MKVTINKIALLGLVLGITIVSCKKETDETPTPTAAVETKTQLLTGKQWKTTALTSNPAGDWNGNGTLTTDFFGAATACVKDGFTVFNTNGTTSVDEGLIKCDTTKPQTSYGTWAFNTSETTITIDNTTIYNLELLNSTTLKMNTVLLVGSTNYTMTATMTKQ